MFLKIALVGDTTFLDLFTLSKFFHRLLTANSDFFNMMPNGFV